VYGPLAPVRWAVSATGKALNRGLLVLEGRGFPDLKSPASPVPPRTWRLRPVFAPGRNGAGADAGLRADIPIDKFDFTASGRLSTRLYQIYAASLTGTFHSITTGPEASFGSMPEEDFFGQGGTSAEADRTNYALQEWRAGWRTTGKWGKADLRHVLYVMNSNLGPGRDEGYPVTQETFSPSEVDGGFVDSEWLTNHFGIAVDYRDNPIDPRAGAAFDASVSVHNGFNGTASDFATFRLTNYFYIPLSVQRKHVLALRSEFVRNESSDPIPFYVQPTLGGSDILRGYREFRFRDRDSFAGSVEYRYEIWPGGLDAVIFGDAGQVYSNIFDEFDDLPMHATVGAGIKLNTRMLKARLDVGHSHESTIVLLRFGTSW
jgi:hypothetical protein